MKQYEINTKFINQEITSNRKREWFFSLLVLMFFILFSYYTKQEIILTIFISLILLVMFPLKIYTRYNKFSYCFKIIINEDRIIFYFLHPFYRTNIKKEFNVNELSIESSNNNNLCTISFSTNSEIYTKQLFSLSTHFEGWETEQLLEIEKVFLEKKSNC